MLIGYNPTDPLYVIGTGIPAQEIVLWIKQEYPAANIEAVSREQYDQLPSQSQCVIGFANTEYRKNLINHHLCKKQRWLTFVHPTSTVENIDAIGKGSMIEPNSTVMDAVCAGEFLWVTPHCMIGHGSKLGINVVINPGTIIGGSVNIGNNVSIGQSSSICDRLTIVNDVEICMGSVVTKNIVESGKYYGNRKTHA